MSSVNAAPFLTVSMYSRRRLEQRPDDVDDFAHDELEHSFASTVSLNSPTQSHADLTPDSDYGVPMDISPAPARKLVVEKSLTRPRASTMAGRIFGSDVSNKEPTKLENFQRERSGSTHLLKHVQRPSLPATWRMAPAEPPSPMDDAMDVDTSFIVDSLPSSHSTPVIPQSSGSTVTSFSNLFYETASPRTLLASPVDRYFPKRRSTSPDRVLAFGPADSEDLSSPGLPSPSDRLASRVSSQKGYFFSGNSSSSNKPRRPSLIAARHNLDVNTLHSAFPTLESINSDRIAMQAPPPRRAFSATLGAAFGEDSSFEEPDGSSPAQAYAQRQQARTIRRRDGTDNFFPDTGATAMLLQESPPRRVTVTGLPGFGDNERVGKILPCHSVSEDGLVRITPQTLNDLMDGAFNDRIHDFHVIDCRFDYEFEGGHIPCAVNINTPAAVESLLLGPSLTKPKPSVSGDSYRKTVLVFHCEFSMKRAPTFAKHLRAKDRSMNNGVYPKIHFPEVYILEGGYCNYFKAAAARCTPQAYVTMDDPSHAVSRREDLDQFRKAKFGRHKSYTYGDANGRLPTVASTKRNTAPINNGPASVFAAGNAARTRRVGATSTHSLMTLVEDNAVVADDEDDTDTEIGDSPCPRPPPVKKGRVPFGRAETYGPARMPF